MEKEIRSIDSDCAEIRLVKRTRKIEGYGIVFNKESKDLGGFTEIIEPGAVDEEVIKRSDILALLNHNEDKGLLARSTGGEGTLELTIDDKGVKYTFDAPDTALGDELISGVRRGDIRTSSFAFGVIPNNKDHQIWEKRSNGTYLRKIKKFTELHDISPCYREAYADTSVALRNLSNLKDMKPGEENRTVMDITKMRKETLKDGTVILYEDWLSKGSQIFVEKDGAVTPAADGQMTIREREEIYTSNMTMTIKDGFVTEITSTSTNVQRREPGKPVETGDLTEYYKELRNKIPKK